MEDKNPKSDEDSDIIIIENIPDIIPVLSSPEKHNKQTPKKQKMKKQKLKKQQRRKVKLELAKGNAMENLLITQRLKVKRAKFRCIINVNTVCKEQKSESIKRFSKNEWKKEAYYDRIAPICLRNKCFTDNNKNNKSKSSCCRTARNKSMCSLMKRKIPESKQDRKERNSNDDNTAKLNPEKRDGMLSPVSSLPLTEDLENISYEEVSIGTFSSSEDELDTLIKRTKEREKLIDPLNVFSAPVSSTPIHDLASTSDMSLHSLATLVLTPLKTEAYSPTISPKYTQDYVPYSPTMTPDFIKMENQYPSIHSPYSPTDPTVTPPKYNIKLEKDGRVISPYSLASPWLESQIDEVNRNRVLELVKDERIDINNAIKTEEITVKSEKNSYGIQ